jgi:UDP-N-acetylglucosamine/UDP-N-acetylgalactosamine diphosphorylase
MTKHHLQAILRPHGQEHLLAFWDELEPRQRESLARQIEAIDFELIRRLYEGRGSIQGDSPIFAETKIGTVPRDGQEDVRALAARAEPPPALRLDAARNPFTAEQARQRADEALRAGQLGVILVAGGQGTRLGFNQPKGTFCIGPLSGKTLFQIHVEKIIAAGRRYGVRIPLYLMTSPATHEATTAFFAEHGRFGLPADDLLVFCQGTMPAVDAENGRVLLESRGQIAVSPDGHGGLLAALARSGAIADMHRRGVRHLFYLQVDNPLVDICGREFVGYHLLAGSELTTQVVAKQDPRERVGNVVKVDGRPMVIEYSDLPDDAAERRNADGSLAIWAGSIAVHAIDAALLARLAGAADALPFHIARKKVAYVNAAGERVEPAQPNAIKFERFIFDLMPHAQYAVVVEVERQRAFAPLKNASGSKEDTPETVRAQMAAYYRDWLRRAGATVAADAVVEISPLCALDAEELAAKIPRGMRVSGDKYFG